MGLIVDLFAGGGPLAQAHEHVVAEKHCLVCGGGILRSRRDARFCCAKCGIMARGRRDCPTTIRKCKACPRVFIRLGRYEGNAWHCSDECSQRSAQRHRAAFQRRRPERDAIYRERQRAKKRRDTSIERLWKKHPEVPRHCEACGETRVLDIAHRPDHARRGAWRTMRNCTPDKIWVLCPTCHALLDRLGYTAEQLGIRERKWAS